MFGFFKSKLVLWILTVILGIILAILIVNKDTETTPLPNNIFGLIVTPFQKLITVSGSGINDFFEYFYSKKSLIKENELLKQQINSLEKSNNDFTLIDNENNRLRQMLDLRQRETRLQLTAAEVIAQNSGNWFSIFTIDKGTLNGIKKKQAVITSSGLVGNVLEVGTSWAKVVTIVDPDSSAGSIVTRTGDIGIVQGDIILEKSGQCKMAYLSKSKSILAGDVIETSGLGGIYPKGILIGKVKGINSDVEGISQFAVIEPAVDFEKIKEVFVIKNIIQ